MQEILIIGLVCLAVVAATSRTVQTWTTICESSSGAAKQILKSGEISCGTDSSGDVEITVHLDEEQQSMVGFGAGLPQASAYTLWRLKQQSQSSYQQVMDSLFSVEKGIGLNILRFPLGSCDFSMHNTSFDEYLNDYALQHFALDADTQYIVEVLKDAKQINPTLQLIGMSHLFSLSHSLYSLSFYTLYSRCFAATPWSAPSWMKVYGSLIAQSPSNTLIDSNEIFSSYAQYLLLSLQSFADIDLHIDYLTLQNEPLFGTSTEYPGMYLSASDSVRLAKTLRPLLQQAKFKTALLAYDHNWDHPEYVTEALTSG